MFVESKPLIYCICNFSVKQLKEAFSNSVADFIYWYCDGIEWVWHGEYVVLTK